MPECIPLLAVALELISRGPAALTIAAVKHYRASAMNPLKQIRPALEQESRRRLASWTSELFDAACGSPERHATASLRSFSEW